MSQTTVECALELTNEVLYEVQESRHGVRNICPYTGRSLTAELSSRVWDGIECWANVCRRSSCDALTTWLVPEICTLMQKQSPRKACLFAKKSLSQRHWLRLIVDVTARRRGSAGF